jgi:hypothetical protein
MWYGAIALVVILGFAGIISSRQQRRSELAAGANATPPVVNKDHWHAAVGFFLCDNFAPPITLERDPKGIHTHGDGVIHIHPFVRSAAGTNATLGQFADAVQMKLTDDKIQLPGGKAYEEGKTKCDGKAGLVQARVWSPDGTDKIITSDIRSIRLLDRELLTIAFAPKGTELAKPPSEPKLNDLEDVAPQPTVPPAGTTETTTAGGDTSTTVAGTTPTTNASTTTAKP